MRKPAQFAEEPDEPEPKDAGRKWVLMLTVTIKANKTTHISQHYASRVDWTSDGVTSSAALWTPTKDKAERLSPSEVFKALAHVRKSLDEGGYLRSASPSLYLPEHCVAVDAED